MSQKRIANGLLVGPLEASAPLMWLAAGALGVVAFNRAGEQKEDYVEKVWHPRSFAQTGYVY